MQMVGEIDHARAGPRRVYSLDGDGYQPHGSSDMYSVTCLTLK